MPEKHTQTAIQIPFHGFILEGELGMPSNACGTVLFAHGSGSSRHSPRNQFVARTLREHGIATLLFDLLTETEERADARSGHLRFDIPLLAERLLEAALWYHRTNPNQSLGYFGSSTGGAAALMAAARAGEIVRAIVSRGGRPDLAGPALAKVKCPTLLVVGGEDTQVIALNHLAYAEMGCLKELRIVKGATHLFEESGALEEVARMAAEWFATHFGSTQSAQSPGSTKPGAR
jgi:pimeloyl-ACP methyl ester carboxylesterase